MKNVTINFLVLLAVLSSCTTTGIKNKKTDETVRVDTLAATQSGANMSSKDAIPTDFSALVPIALLDSTNENVYEKYGLEFLGNCYACDLASLAVSENTISWTNVCDDADSYKMDAFSSTIEGDKVRLRTAERFYIITKIDEAPVYRLHIEGQALELKNKRIAQYFTSKVALSRFKEHDCGDFDG